MRDLIVMRGLPGSGKSTRAQELMAKHLAHPGHTGVILSADQFFTTPDGVYRYDPAKIILAHAQCQFKTVKAMRRGYNLIIIDNTNVTYDEFWFYLALTEEFEYSYRCEVMPERNIQVLAERNIHKVPLDTLAKMIMRWEE